MKQTVLTIMRAEIRKKKKKIFICGQEHIQHLEGLEKDMGAEQVLIYHQLRTTILKNKAFNNIVFLK